MPQFPSDPSFNVQFRRRWSDSPASVKFLSELNDVELDRLSIARGERVLRRLPPDLTCVLNPEERRDLALAFGRPVVRKLRERARPMLPKR
jgi:hypothetical protein